MTVASLELCKKLFELSGWETERFYWSDTRDKDYRVEHYKELEILDYKPKWFNNPKENDGVVVPAYSLGELLCKLAKPVTLRRYDSSDVVWSAEHLDTEALIRRERQADTPEDAVCKLCIELFKQGILTRAAA